MKERLYDFLVNRNVSISEKYRDYRESVFGWRRVFGWFFLIKINLVYLFANEKRTIKNHKKKGTLKESESSLSFRESPEEFAHKLEQYDIVCFDVFDTLVFRPFAHPADIHYFVGGELRYLNFAKIRREAEQKARRIKKENYGTYEVTLDEIWKVVEEETGINRELGMEIEWQCELEYCFANPYMESVLEYLRQSDLHMIIISDMYLGTERIKKILKKCNIDRFCDYFVSCDYRKSKSDGSLYEAVKEKYGRSLKYVQIGDNLNSDINEAKKHGFSTIHYKNINKAGHSRRTQEMSRITGSVYQGLVNSYIHNGLRKYSIEYEFGFIYGGIFCLGYCRWIHDYVQENGIDKILFLSRDGDILKKVYQFLYPEEKEICYYAYWSRLAAVKMTADHNRYDYFRRFLFHKVNQGYYIKNVFCSMELEDMLEGFLKDERVRGRYIKTSLLNVDAAQRIQTYLRKNWDQVLAHYNHQTEGGGVYYKKILNGAQKAVAVDSGWAGSGAVALNYLVNDKWGINCEIIGLLAGTNSAYSQEPDSGEALLYKRKLASYVFSQEHNREIWEKHNPNRGDNLVVELLLSSVEGTLRGFAKNGTPLLDRQNDGEYILEIQQGIFDYVKWYMKRMGKIPKVSGNDAYAPLMLVMQNAEWCRKVMDLRHQEINLE